MSAPVQVTAERPLTLIGCGHMAGAMLGRWLETGLDPAAVQVVRPSGRPGANGVAVVTEVVALDRRPGAVMLAVKPQRLAEVVDAVRPLTVGVPLLSILAGTRLARLAELFPQAAVVRAMPNLPVRGGDGVVGLTADDPDGAAACWADALMRSLGLVEWVPEDRFDALTALAGSGPAYLYRFVAALAAAGEDAGLDPDQALRLARATVRGAARVVSDTDDTPDALADRVASKGGSTRAGLDVLDRGEALAELTRRTIAAAVARNRAMAQETGTAVDSAPSLS